MSLQAFYKDILGDEAHPPVKEMPVEEGEDSRVASVSRRPGASKRPSPEPLPALEGTAAEENPRGGKRPKRNHSAGTHPEAGYSAAPPPQGYLPSDESSIDLSSVGDAIESHILTNMTEPVRPAEPAAPSNPTEEGRRLRVFGFPPAVTEGDLSKFFSNYPVQLIDIVTPRKVKSGTALVDVSTAAEAQRAINEMDGQILGERRIAIRLQYMRKPPEAPQPRKKTQPKAVPTSSEEEGEIAETDTPAAAPHQPTPGSQDHGGPIITPSHALPKDQTKAIRQIAEKLIKRMVSVPLDREQLQKDFLEEKALLLRVFCSKNAQRKNPKVPKRDLRESLYKLVATRGMDPIAAAYEYLDDVLPHEPVNLILGFHTLEHAATAKEFLHDQKLVKPFRVQVDTQAGLTGEWQKQTSAKHKGPHVEWRKPNKHAVEVWVACKSAEAESKIRAGEMKFEDLMAEEQATRDNSRNSSVPAHNSNTQPDTRNNANTLINNSVPPLNLSQISSSNISTEHEPQHHLNGMHNGLNNSNSSRSPSMGIVVHPSTDVSEMYLTLSQLTPKQREYQEKVWFRFNDDDYAKCGWCKENGHIKETCSARTCQHCGAAEKHLTRKCPMWKKCRKCRERGHSEHACQSKLKRISADGLVCDYCFKEGHFEEDCPFPWLEHFPEKKGPVRKVESISVVMSCYNCASNTHWGDDCPRPPWNADERSKMDSWIRPIWSAKEMNKYLIDPVKYSNGISIKGQANHREDDNEVMSYEFAQVPLAHETGNMRLPPRPPSPPRAPRPIVRLPNPNLPPRPEVNARGRQQNNRGSDGYVRYEPNYAAFPPPPSYAPRRRSRSPEPAQHNGYRTEGYQQSYRDRRDGPQQQRAFPPRDQRRQENGPNSAPSMGRYQLHR